MSTNTTINFKPTNLVQEEFAKYQKFGLQPYDRAPNDYLRFVAKVFTAWRDPEDKILNYDPFDDFGTGSTQLQATSDKSIVSYIDGFVTDYQFTRLTTDAASTDMTRADNIIEETPKTVYYDETGTLISIDKAKYGEYHRFIIQPGICFIDNQLIEIVETTEWWFRVPEVRDYTNGLPNYELGQFIIDPLNVYSLLPNQNYKIILSYEYITQFESSTARLQFITDEVAIDEPYLLVGSFSTDTYGMVHQTQPQNEQSVLKYEDYIIKEDVNPQNGNIENYYYLRNINPQYLDKKFMANYKNLFKHLQSQLMTVLSESKIANTFHMRVMTEEIDPSVSSGDFVWLDPVAKRWFPAEISRQIFDKVNGLYLKSQDEGTDLLFTSGIIEIDNKYQIIDKENNVLRNMIPGTEYFLQDDLDSVQTTAPFIDVILIEDNRDIPNGHFRISTTIIAKADAVTIDFTNNPESPLIGFKVSTRLELDYKTGEQRIPQTISWDVPQTSWASIPPIKNDTGNVKTEALQFKFTLDMVQNPIEEENQRIINDFKANAITLEVDYTYIKDGSQVTETVTIRDSDLYLGSSGLSNALIGPKQPIMNLADILSLETRKAYPTLNLLVGQRFQDSNEIISPAGIKAELDLRVNELDNILYNEDASNLGLFNKMELLSAKLNQNNNTIINLQEALDILVAQYKLAKIDFQSTESDLQAAISTAYDIFLSYSLEDKLYRSKKFLATQERDAVDFAINTLIDEILTIEANKSDIQNTNSNITDLIADAGDQKDIVLSNITIREANIVTFNGNINLDNNLIDMDLVSARSSQYPNGSIGIPGPNSFDFVNYIHRVTRGNLAVSDTKNEFKYLSRILHNINMMNNLRKSISLTEPTVNTEEAKLKLLNDSYINDTNNNLLTESQKLVALSNIKAQEVIYNNIKAKLDADKVDLEDYTIVYKNLIQYKDNLLLPAAELFAEFSSGPYPLNGTWPTSEFLTFTMLLSEPLTKDIQFQFIYKEDTQDVGTIIIPAGQTSGTFSIFTRAFPNTYLNCGLPKWIVNSYNGIVVDPASTDNIVLDLNQFNQTLVNWYKDTTLDASENLAYQYVYSLDSTKYNLNARKVEYQMPVLNYSILKSYLGTAMGLINKNEDLFNQKTNLQNEQEALDNENSNRDYYTQYITSMQMLIDNGEMTIDLYDAEIVTKTNIKNMYLNGPDPINILGSTKCKATLLTEINYFDALIMGLAATLATAKDNWDIAKLNLKTATEIALNKYTITIEEHKKQIQLKKNDNENIKVISSLYDGQTALLVGIHNNIRDISNSGVFLLPAEEILLRRFQYQTALDNQVIETIDKLILLPTSTLQVPDTLEFVCGTNGVQYPTNLQPWIFVKSRGKISPRNYPGATSVGIALNENTLILNIRTNRCPDISEMLNVYGNGTDFISQLTSVYNYKNSSKNNIKINTASAVLQKELDLIRSKTNIGTTNTLLIDGKTITSTLSQSEMATIYKLVITKEGRELLWRLIYSKYYGSYKANQINSSFNPADIIYNWSGVKDGVTIKSPSSFFNTVGNIYLNNSIDNFRLTSKTFTKVTGDLYTNLKTSANLNELDMKSLFFEIGSLYRELDIIKIIISNMPEVLINYEAKGNNLKQKYLSLIINKLTLSRLNLDDNPINDHIDPFENPNLDDAQSSVRDPSIDNLVISYTNDYTTIKSELVTFNNAHTADVQELVYYRKFIKMYRTLKYTLGNAIDHYNNKKQNYSDLITLFGLKVKENTVTYNDYFKRTNKLPNVMWDVFNITEGQRLKWNYTYCALRIMGMQKELNNTVTNSIVQFSPINSEINELQAKLSLAKKAGKEADAVMYQISIDGIQTKKDQFTAILQNYIEEFNAIQRKYNLTTITIEQQLTVNKLNTELYIQDPNEYNLSYAFNPVPVYNNINI